MSYDVDIGDFEANYTSNGNDIYYNNLDGGLPALDGLTGKQAASKIETWIYNFDREVLDNWESAAIGEPKITEKYDSSNGWGSTIGAIIFLMKILSACNKYPKHKLKISY